MSVRLSPPRLGQSEWAYRETRRRQDQSELRADRPPATGALYKPGWLDNWGTRLLPPAIYSVEGMSVHPSLNAVAMCVTHAPPEPRLRVEGTNLAQWPLMSSVPGLRPLANAGNWLCGVAWSPQGDRLACLEGPPGALSLFDAGHGQRTFLTTIGHVYGDETPMWSPDGRWLLLPTRPRPLLVSLDHRVIVDLPLEGAQVDWHPAAGASTLLTLHDGPPAPRVGNYDLSTGGFTDLGAVILPEQPDQVQYLHQPRVSPDGRRLLMGSNYGPPARYQEMYGIRFRVALVELGNLKLQPLIGPSADPGGWFEREHSHWSWIPRRRPAPPVTVAAELVAGGRPFDTADPHTGADRSGRDETVVVWTW